jgi:hypothetical protein
MSEQESDTIAVKVASNDDACSEDAIFEIREEKASDTTVTRIGAQRNA